VIHQYHENVRKDGKNHPLVIRNERNIKPKENELIYV